jgi:hypothetical protein
VIGFFDIFNTDHSVATVLVGGEKTKAEKVSVYHSLI